MGAAVGYIISAMVVQGFRIAVAAAAEADTIQERVEELRTEVMHAIKRLEEERLLLEDMMARDATSFQTLLLPAMDKVEASLTSGAAQTAMDALAALNVTLGTHLGWTTLPEFDHFMGTDEHLTL